MHEREQKNTNTHRMRITSESIGFAGCIYTERSLGCVGCKGGNTHTSLPNHHILFTYLQNQVQIIIIIDHVHFLSISIEIIKIGVECIRFVFVCFPTASMPIIMASFYLWLRCTLDLIKSNAHAIFASAYMGTCVYSVQQYFMCLFDDLMFDEFSTLRLCE